MEGRLIEIFVLVIAREDFMVNHVLETFRVSLEGQDFKFNALAGSGSVVSFLILA